MKNKLTLIALLLFSSVGHSQALYTQPDKQFHFIAGTAIALVSYPIFYRMTNSKWKAHLYSTALVTAVGMLKEGKDELDYGGWDNQDLGATIAGGAWVNVTFNIFTGNKKRKLKYKSYERK